MVLFSGGQDSTTVLFWALKKFSLVETIGFEYGQRHSTEMQCRIEVLKKLKIQFPKLTKNLGKDHILDIASISKISNSALTNNVKIENDKKGIPNTFVPGRNLFFLVLAGSLAYNRKINTLSGGMCETDFSGYPDCRRETIESQEKALSLGLDKDIKILTPLMYMDKASIWLYASKYGGKKFLDIIINDTHTCYLGDRVNKNIWGYGCGKCPSCLLRSQGYFNWKKL